jgi:hypothetical protein
MSTPRGPGISIGVRDLLLFGKGEVALGVVPPDGSGCLIVCYGRLLCRVERPKPSPGACIRVRVVFRFVSGSVEGLGLMPIHDGRQQTVHSRPFKTKRTNGGITDFGCPFAPWALAHPPIRLISALGSDTRRLRTVFSTVLASNLRDWGVVRRRIGHRDGLHLADTRGSCAARSQDAIGRVRVRRIVIGVEHRHSLMPRRRKASDFRPARIGTG